MIVIAERGDAAMLAGKSAQRILRFVIPAQAGIHPNGTALRGIAQMV